MTKNTNTNTIITEVNGITAVEYGTPLDYRAGATLQGLTQLLLFARNTLAEWLDIEPEAVNIKGYYDPITAHRSKKARFNYAIKYKDQDGKIKRGSIIFTYANDLIIIGDDIQITQFLIV